MYCVIRVQALALVILLAVAVSASAQATAELAGRVTDESGAVLPGVTVTATQTDTGLARTAVTDETGGYLLTNLPIGPYRLEVVLQGFRTYVQTGIVLQVGAAPTINAVLGVGNLEETVSVEAAAPLVDVRSAGISEVVENERIVELPLQGRRVTDLIVLAGADGEVQLVGQADRELAEHGPAVLLGARDIDGARRGERNEHVLIDGEVYHMPWDWGNESIIYRTDKVELQEETLALMVDERYRGQLAMYDSVDSMTGLGGKIERVRIVACEPVEVLERRSCAPRFLTYGCALGVDTIPSALRVGDRTVRTGAPSSSPMPTPGCRSGLRSTGLSAASAWPRRTCRGARRWKSRAGRWRSATGRW